MRCNRPRRALTVMCITIAAGLGVANVADGQPIAHWRFDEGGGTVAIESVSGLHGVLQGDAALVADGGRAGGAVRLKSRRHWDPAGGRVNCGDVLGLDGWFTLSAWFRTDSTCGETVVGRFAGSTPGGGYQITVNQYEWAGEPGRAGFWPHPGPPGLTSNSVVNDGQWHHVAVVSRPCTQSEIYIDGRCERAQYGGIPGVPYAEFLVGGTMRGGLPVGNFSGMIDDVQMYAATLSPTHVKYLSDHPGEEVPTILDLPPVAHWRFDVDAGAVERDNGGGYDAIARGASAVVPGAGVSGSCRRFSHGSALDPEGGRVEVGDVLGYPGQDRSFSFWIRTSAIERMLVTAKHNPPWWDGYRIMVNGSGSGSGTITMLAGGELAGTTRVIDGQWHHVVCTYQAGGTEAIYVDGALDAVGPGGCMAQAAGAPLVIGGGINEDWTTGGDYTGDLDEVQIYNYVLTDDQIRFLGENPSHEIGEDAPALMAFDACVVAVQDQTQYPFLWRVDPDGDAHLEVVTPPSHGRASLAGEWPAYTPDPGYTGPDVFTYRLRDGDAPCELATVNITVVPWNTPPRADSQFLQMEGATSIDIRLGGYDDYAPQMLCHIVSGPSHGALSGTPPFVTYTPEPGFGGCCDVFSFQFNDGLVDGNIAYVSVHVEAAGGPPVAHDQQVITSENTPIGVTLSATDPDGDPVRYTVRLGPSHGSLSGSAPDLTYTPATGYSGPDSFTFTAMDGTSDSNTATVSITVVAATPPPADDVGPQTAVGLSGAVGANGWFVGDVTVTITATDLPDPGYTGVAIIHYVLDGTAMQTVNVVPATRTAVHSFTVSTDGYHTLEAWAVDASGNAGAHASVTRPVDATAPTCSAVQDGGVVLVGASDSVSGIEHVAYTIDDGAEQHCAPETAIALPEGEHTIVVWSVDRAGNQSDRVVIRFRIDKTPPVLQMPADIVFEQSGPTGSIVTFSVAATDNLDPAPTVVCTPWSGSVFPPGTTTVTCFATDSAGNTVAGSFAVTVRDTLGPTISAVSVDASSLWPANHKMVDVTVNYAVTDAGDSAPSCVLSVSSNEPVNGTGDGDTAPDWEVIDAHHVRLRAERAGNGTGRIYTITITCTDKSGNVSTTQLAVTVPTSQGG